MLQNSNMIQSLTNDSVHLENEHPFGSPESFPQYASGRSEKVKTFKQHT